jgi:16S rRNA (uracil1498-N3)-methyltransferase
MAHVPHLLLRSPWADSHIALEPATRKHLEKVLRRARGSAVSYTDGEGTLGTGTLAEGPDGAVVVLREHEERVARFEPAVTIAVAPPKATDRVRFLVEKLAELGVDRIAWLRTAHGEGRPPSPAKTAAWATMALEQSRAAWRTEVAGSMNIGDLPDGAIYADPGGGPWDAGELRSAGQSLVVAIGPEGGFAPGEIPAGAPCVRLSERVLRVETAAIVAAVLVRA